MASAAELEAALLRAEAAEILLAALREENNALREENEAFKKTEPSKVIDPKRVSQRLSIPALPEGLPKTAEAFLAQEIMRSLVEELRSPTSSRRRDATRLSVGGEEINYSYRHIMERREIEFCVSKRGVLATYFRSAEKELMYDPAGAWAQSQRIASRLAVHAKVDRPEVRSWLGDLVFETIRSLRDGTIPRFT